MKSSCLIYGNCQGTGLAAHLKLSPEFTRRFEIRLSSNWAENTFPLDELERCDLFLYQPTAARQGIPSTAELAGRLKPTATALSFPYMYFKGFWPFHARSCDTNTGPCFPRERHYYADTVLDRLAGTDLPVERIKRVYLALDFQGEFEIRAMLEDTLSRQRAKEAGTDVTTCDLLERSYQDLWLFWTVRHPTGPLYLHSANQVLRRLGWPRLPGSALHRAERVYLTDYQHPIHPAIASLLGLRFITPATRYNLWGDLFSYEDYLEDYVVNRRLLQALRSRAA